MMAINFMLGCQAAPIVTPTSLLGDIANTGWANEIAEGGSGVSFAEFVSAVKESQAAFRLQARVVESIRPTDDTPENGRQLATSACDQRSQ
jgi:hypothetical protein